MFKTKEGVLFEEETPQLFPIPAHKRIHVCPNHSVIKKKPFSNTR